MTGEGELLFPPLSHLEVVDSPKVEMRDKRPVIVVAVKVDINQKAMVIEEILRQRKKAVITIADSIINEIEFDSQIVSSTTFFGSELRKKLRMITGHHDEWFNSDKNLRNALSWILALKKSAIEEIVNEALKDADQKVSSFHHLLAFIAFTSCLIFEQSPRDANT